jgi:glycolate oxidase FAD binding subunit
MTITAQAGVTLAHIQRLLAEREQTLPLDPPLPERATVGGILATNASGPLRYQFGMPRDLALGAVVVYADGTVAKSGGRTVKNVAGYDMTRLHIGAFGTLGVIVEATFKVSPLPRVLVTSVGTFATLAAAVSAARALRMARIVPWSLALVGPGALASRGDGYTVAVRLGGQPAVVTPQKQRALDTLKEAQGSAVAEAANAEETFWPQVRDWPATMGDAESVMVRIGVAPSRVQNALEAAQNAAAGRSVTSSSLAFPGAATVYCSLAGDAAHVADAVASLTAAAKELNGNLVVERCPSALKGRLAAWGGAQADALTQRVKQTYDPHATLNPGRFVGGL